MTESFPSSLPNGGHQLNRVMQENTDLLWVVNRQGFRVGAQRVLGGFELMSKRPDKDNISVKN